MFKHIDTNSGAELRFVFDGQQISARDGDTVAAALLAAGVVVFRQTPNKSVDRGPFCLMGACYDCLVMIDDQMVQACQTQVQQGMKVASPSAVGRFATAAQEDIV